MRLRVLAVSAIILTALTACGGTSAKGIVSEKHNPRNGVNVSKGKCAKTQWLLVIDQGLSVRKNDRLKYVCVTETTANKYSILATYP